MSSRLRLVSKIGGEWTRGSRVKEILEAYVGHRLHGINEIIVAAQNMNSRLFIWREPRRLASKRSRYAVLCTRLNLLPKRKAKRNPARAVDWGNPPVVAEDPRGGLDAILERGNHGANQQRPARAAQAPRQGNVNNGF